MYDILKAKLAIWNQWLNSLKGKLRNSGNECNGENVWEWFVCARATYLTICGTVVQGHTKDAVKKLGKCKLGHLMYDYKI